MNSVLEADGVGHKYIGYSWLQKFRLKGLVLPQ